MTILLFLNLGTPEIILILLTAGVPFALALICIVDIIKSDFKNTNTKLLWAVIVLIAPLFGSLIYLIMGKKQKSNIV